MEARLENLVARALLRYSVSLLEEELPELIFDRQDHLIERVYEDANSCREIARGCISNKTRKFLLYVLEPAFFT